MTHQNCKHKSRFPDHVEHGEHGDWDVFKHLRKLRSAVRTERRDDWETLHTLGLLPKGWVKHTDAHYSYVLEGRKLDYWPGPKKWQYGGKISTGEVLDFIRRKEKR